LFSKLVVGAIDFHVESLLQELSFKGLVPPFGFLLIDDSLITA